MSCCVVVAMASRSAFVGWGDVVVIGVGGEGVGVGVGGCTSWFLRCAVWSSFGSSFDGSKALIGCRRWCRF